MNEYKTWNINNKDCMKDPYINCPNSLKTAWIYLVVISVLLSSKYKYTADETNALHKSLSK